MDRTHKTLEEIVNDLESGVPYPSFDELVEKGLIKVNMVDSPCDTCPFEWHDLKHKTSCRDECEAYKAYIVKSNMADTLPYGPRIEASPK